MNKRLNRHSSCASSRRVLFDKTFIGFIGKMAYPDLNLEISLREHALTSPRGAQKTSLPQPGSTCFGENVYH